MSQSTADRFQGSDWMDLERQYEAELHPDQVRVEPDPHARLAALRGDVLRSVVTAVRDRGRAPRVCLYALSVGGVRPSNSLKAAAIFATRSGWQTYGNQQSFTDPHGAPAPEARPGWGLVRRQISAGYADGVVVATTSVISPNFEQYERELRWFALHRAFVGVIAPSVQGRL
ncbi:hypothetical protein [Streptomyces sp. PTY087I2]|uniref:hypothetical protein n=1 Tax=Streptomyces sp. PTY087I2 TaxID=1819298 RepID=UPI00080B2A69|nr:hypothetical protein [Streptomyces sp. PTY087I2]OCC13988.1 hypothetical protein A3Q37_00260 [Streptomyces sp. PTY087I2]